MDRRKFGPGFVVIGVVLFVSSLFVILPMPTLYLTSLFLMFVAVVLIGVGAAFVKDVDRNLDVPRDECYYCQGTGRKAEEVCPRCGGSGLARPDDE
ncbi:MAG: hypothetical protein ACW98U_11835 [Candidatus Thorarchaeota archaeon]|jgi:membrane protein implicated in regulation of membrane protease activity